MLQTDQQAHIECEKVNVGHCIESTVDLNLSLELTANSMFKVQNIIKIFKESLNILIITALYCSLYFSSYTIYICMVPHLYRRLCVSHLGGFSVSVDWSHTYGLWQLIDRRTTNIRHGKTSWQCQAVRGRLQTIRKLWRVLTFQVNLCSKLNSTNRHQPVL